MADPRRLRTHNCTLYDVAHDISLLPMSSLLDLLDVQSSMIIQCAKPRMLQSITRGQSIVGQMPQKPLEQVS